MRDGRILSWSHGTLGLWTATGYTEGQLLTGDIGGIRSARELDDGRILSWSWDGTLRLWGRDGSANATFRLDALPVAVAGTDHELHVIAERFNRLVIYDLVGLEP